jgi:hypothetical protein
LPRLWIDLRGRVEAAPPAGLLGPPRRVFRIKLAGEPIACFRAHFDVRPAERGCLGQVLQEREQLLVRFSVGDVADGFAGAAEVPRDGVLQGPAAQVLDDPPGVVGGHEGVVVGVHLDVLARGVVVPAAEKHLGASDKPPLVPAASTKCIPSHHHVGESLSFAAASVTRAFTPSETTSAER